MQIEIPIDFDNALIDSGSIIIVILIVSLIIYASRIREIYSDIGTGTKRALIAYSFTGIAMSLATLFGIHEAYRFMITGTGSFFLGAIVIAQAWILWSPNRAKQVSIITVLIIIGVFVNNFLEEFLGFPLYFMMIGLSILLVLSVYLSVVLLRENPSTFSVSLLVVLFSYMSTWIFAATGWTFSHPQYYILQVIPLIVAATVFASVRKPGRRTLATFIMYFTITIGLPLVVDAFRVGSWVIFYFVGVEIFTALCLIAPLEYFLEQASETGARMPLYLGAVVTFVALLVSTHSLSWALFINQRLVWNQYLVWVDVLLGSCAIIAFMLAAVSSFFGDWVQTFTREAMIIFGTSAAFLTFPLTQPVTVTNEYVWTAIGVIIAIGTLMFIRLSIRIARSGGSAAAGRLMMFIISALMIAIVSMYSDNIPPEPPAIPTTAMLILLLAGTIAVFSSPPVTARLSRTVERLEELEELGVEDDGSIKIEY
ncbi:MAG: hypothetical protein ACFFEK_12580 [Candidatus Thorarchaeota archaeon]